MLAICVKNKHLKSLISLYSFTAERIYDCYWGYTYIVKTKIVHVKRKLDEKDSKYDAE